MVFDRLKSLFADDAATQQTSIDAKQLACAALLVEAALMDGRFEDLEETRIKALLQRHFALTVSECEELLKAAKQEQSDSNQIVQFTREVKEHFDEAGRIDILEMLWDVAYADGVLHEHEDQLIRRIAGLLYISDRERGLARKRVLARRP